MNQRDQILETMRRVLRQTTLRAILRPLGRTPLDVTQDEADALLESYEAAIENDFVMCCEVANQLAALEQHVEDEQPEDGDSVSLNSDDEDSDP